jgi:beta-galactosidase/beta-glucuronidase
VGPIILSDKNIDGVTALETPQWRGGISGGIWQNVRLLASGNTYVKDVFIETNIHDNTATFHITIDHTEIKGDSADIEIHLSEASNIKNDVASYTETQKVEPGLNEHKVVIKIPEARYWSPDDPFLYQAKLKIKRKQKISDDWHHRFGLRELTIKNQDFYLNRKRIYIKASFFEGLYPNSIAYPDSEEMARKEIRLAKEAGFNMIRPWRHPTTSMWLDLADEMGVMVVGSPALECMRLPLSSPYLPSRVSREVEQTLLKDRNRTCIVQWELFNELHRPVLKQLMRPMAMLSRDLDPTRLILDESGGWAFGANMYLPYEKEPTKFNDIHLKTGRQRSSIYNSMR